MIQNPFSKQCVLYSLSAESLQNPPPNQILYWKVNRWGILLVKIESEIEKLDKASLLQKSSIFRLLPRKSGARVYMTVSHLYHKSKKKWFTSDQMCRHSGRHLYYPSISIWNSTLLSFFFKLLEKPTKNKIRSAVIEAIVT